MDHAPEPAPAPARATPAASPDDASTAERISAFASFRERNFAVMWTASLVSQTGQWLQNVAVPFVVFQLTGSGAWLGFTAFMMLLPMVLLGPMAGSVADRFDRRRVLAIGAGLQGLLTAGLWLTWAAGVRSVGVLIVLVTAVSCVAGITVASWQAFVPSLVPRRLLLNAVTLNSAQFNAARAFGPALGGLVIATAGPSWAFFVNAVSFFAIVGGLVLVKVPRIERPPSQGRPRVLAEMWTAMRYVRTQRGIVASLAVVFALGLLGGPLFNLVVVFAQEVYDVGDGAYGVLAACIGIGSILSAPVWAGWGSRQRRGSMVSLAMVGYGAALVAVGAAPVYAVGAAALLVSGAGYLGISSTLNTTIQMQVTELMRGRVLALYVMSLTLAMPIGSLVQGALIDVIGPQWTVAGAGVLFLGVFFVLRFATDLFVHMDDVPDHDRVHEGELQLDVAESEAVEAAVEGR
ncbi:MFS transporter [Rhabdothermincola salaria]|uniref:MFS transporter n=1 Tax=Rhabdothermincola salaria TaxID=2903142 RepID=UPI001E5869FB|nr:MFS transporter [Rhabdothermincola salaria]MCD9623469.1 MFS transporter [Rhabdothermincola salaria]